MLIASRSSSPLAVRDVGQGFVLALLRPSVPVLESLAVQNHLRARNVVCDVVVGEVLAAFVADTALSSSDAPLVAVYLEDPETVAGHRFRTGDERSVHPALVLHQADEVADQTPGYGGSLECQSGFALSEDPRLTLARQQQEEPGGEQQSRNRSHFSCQKTLFKFSFDDHPIDGRAIDLARRRSGGTIVELSALSGDVRLRSACRAVRC